MPILKRTGNRRSASRAACCAAFIEQPARSRSGLLWYASRQRSGVGVSGSRIWNTRREMRTTPSYSPTPMPNSTSERSGFHRASGGKRKNMNLLRCSSNVLTKIPQKRSRCRVPCFVGYGPDGPRPSRSPTDRAVISEFDVRSNGDQRIPLEYIEELNYFFV